MAIDFTLLPDGETFELFCRDVLQSLQGIQILEQPARGPDRKKDFTILVVQEDKLGGSREETYVVQCKHKAVSKKSVVESDLGDIRSVCVSHKVDGYFLITSTIPSTTAGEILTAINDEGKYLTKSWDKKQLERMLEQSPAKYAILERYGMKESLDESFKWFERTLEAGEIPWTRDTIIQEPGMKGIIYTHEDEQLEVVRFAFICADVIFDQNMISQIKAKYTLYDLFVFSTVANDQFNHSHDEFIRRVTCFRDFWYQMKLLHLANFLPQNPGLVRLIAGVIAELPYERYPPLFDIIKTILADRQGLDLMLVVVAAQAAARLNFNETKKAIFDWLESVVYRNRSHWKDSRQFMTAFTQCLVSSLASLDENEIEYEDRVADLWTQGDVQFKCDLLEYFEKLQLPTLINLATDLREHSGEVSVMPRNQCIFYTNPVHFVFNCAPRTVADFVTSYLKVVPKPNQF